MKRILIAAAALLLAAAAFAAWGIAAPGGRLASFAAPAATPKPKPKVVKPKLPALPPIRVRQQEEGQPDLRDDAEPHPDPDLEPRRHHHLDAHLDGGPSRTDRLLDPVLLGDRPAARSEQLVVDDREPRREDRRHHPRCSLCDVGSELLQD